MIRITCLSDPYIGVELEDPPIAILNSLALREWDWEVDYSEATEEEISLWFRKELAIRIFFTLTRGLPVYFQGRQYQSESEGEGDLSETLESLQEDIKKSEGGITIISNDERRLVIGTV